MHESIIYIIMNNDEKNPCAAKCPTANLAFSKPGQQQQHKNIFFADVMECWNAGMPGMPGPTGTL